MKNFRLFGLPATMLLALSVSSISFAAEDTQIIHETRGEDLSKNEKEVEIIDRSVRTSPYASTPSYAQGGDQSRYSTNSGWSRGNYFGYRSWWGGGRSSDIPSSGYTAPSSRR